MHEVRSIQDLISQIRRGEILLPEFQRGYVWSRDQVRGLTQSLYRKQPSKIFAHNPPSKVISFPTAIPLPPTRVSQV